MRRASIGLVALALLAVAVPAQAEDPLEAATAELAKLTSVDGDSVGFDGVEGRFFQLSKVFVAKGGKADFERLLRHANPVARAMGLVCLTRTEGEKAVPVLKRHLADPGRFLYGPGGCVFDHASVGRLALDLIQNRNVLRFHAEPKGLLPRGQMIALNAEILLRDELFDLHGAVDLLADDLLPWDPERKHSDDYASLPKLLPKLPRWRLVKAVGRDGHSPEQRAFLVTQLDGKTSDRQTRLAAASALTRDPHDAALAALTKARKALDEGDPAAPGTRFLNVAALRRKSVDDVMWTRIIDHPLGIGTLARRIGYVGLYEGQPEEERAERDRRVAKIIEIAGRLEEYAQPWNTYSATPWLIRSLVADLMTVHDPGGRPDLTKEEAARLLALVEKHIASRR